VKRGRPLRGALFGFLFGLFLGLDLLLFGMVQLDSSLLTYLPIVFLVLGLIGAIWAPFGRKNAAP
jgi:hypothetical protein